MGRWVGGWVEDVPDYAFNHHSSSSSSFSSFSSCFGGSQGVHFGHLGVWRRGFECVVPRELELVTEGLFEADCLGALLWWVGGWVGGWMSHTLLTNSPPPPPPPSPPTDERLTVSMPTFSPSWACLMASATATGTFTSQILT